MKRNQVYALIDGERAYQDNLPSSRTDGRSHTVGDYIVMLEYYLGRAREQWCMNSGDAMALDEIRKVGAIAVKCMEEWGAPERKVLIQTERSKC